MAAPPNVRTVVTETASRALGLALNVAASEVTLLTGGTGLKDPSAQASGYGGQVLSAIFNNTNTTTARRVKLYLIASGGSLAEATKILDETIPPEGMFYFQPKVPPKYKDSAVVKGMQTVGTDVFCKVEAVEFY